MESNKPLRVCFLTHNLAQDNGAGVFSSRLIKGLKKELGIETVVFTSDGGKKLFLDFFKIRKAIKSCDAVYALDAYPYGVAAYLASFGLHKKFIITAVGSGAVIHLYKWPHSFLLKRAYRRADKVTAVSNFTKNEILKKVPGLKIKVINHGVDSVNFKDERFSERDGASGAPGKRVSASDAESARLNLQNFKPYILSVGSLRWRKGYHRSIEAFKKISEAMPDLHYVIVGKKYADDYYVRLRKLIDNLGLEKRVHILDNIENQNELIDIYKNAELFCLMPQTANRDLEGFGLVFLEAAAAGLAVVGTDGSGTEDAVLDGKNGYLVGPRDIEGFAGAVLRILKNPALRSGMSEASLEFAKNSDWANKIDEYKALYQKLQKPKIVYVTNARLPTEKAHGLATAKIAEAFGDLGYEVDLIIPRRKHQALRQPAYSPAGELLVSRRRAANVIAKPMFPAQTIFEFYQVRSNFNIKKLPTLDFFGILPEKLAFLIQLFSFSMSALFYSTWRFNRQVVFFSHDHVPLWLLSFFGKKIFYDIHHFPDDAFLYRRVLKKSFGIAVQTKWKIKALEEKFGVSPKKIVYWPNGTDIKKFEIAETRDEARKKLGLPQDKKIALYTGQLFDWKGVDTFIKTAAELKNIDFYVVGGSNEDIENPAELGNIYFIGQRPHEEIPLWLRAADVLVLPNTGKQKVSLYYTSPMKMFEYMASGTPIVASNIPSIAEILNDKNAILAKADNSESFAEKIKFVLENRASAKMRAEEALKDVQKYTWAERARRISEKFRSI